MCDPTEFELDWERFEGVRTSLGEERCKLCAFGQIENDSRCIRSPECHAYFRDDDKTYYWRKKLE